MWRDTSSLITERKHIRRELVLLQKKQVALERKQAEIARKSETTAGDPNTLAQLKIATGQLLEAKQMNHRLILQKSKRLEGIEKSIALHK